MSSFRRVNLDPEERVPFHKWCEKIKHFLTAGEQFKEESVDYSPQQLFNMLPPVWHGMLPAERRVSMTVLQSHGFQYTADSLQQLHVECSMPYSQLSDLRICVVVARQHPETLDMTLTKTDTPGQDVKTVQDARAAAAKQSDGLDIFQLHPKDADGKPKFKGLKLLDHVVKRRNKLKAEEVKCGPSAGLDIHLMDDSLEMITPTFEDMRHHGILKDHAGERAKKKCAQRKMNSIGLVVGHCAVVNSAENMQRMQEKLQFAAACAEIHRKEAASKEGDRRKKIKELVDSAPTAARKLAKEPANIGNLTVKEIEALLYKVYNKTVPGSKSKLRKPDYVKALERELAASRGTYEEFVAALEG